MAADANSYRPPTDDEMRRQAEIQAKVFKANGIGLSGDPGRGVSSFVSGFAGVSTSLASASAPLEVGFRTAGKSVGEAALAFNGLSTAITNNLGTWRELSAAGASFDNDIVSMATSASMTRLSLSEYSDLIKEQGPGLAVLGGNVSKGAQEFSKLSNKMFAFDSELGPVTQRLQQMGFVNGELNETLASIVSFQRTNAVADSQAGNEALAATQKLSFEMDKVAKLTGVNRKTLEEENRKAALDSQIQARFKLMELDDAKNGTNYAKAAREEYLIQLDVLKGMGGQNAVDVYKDQFANGALTSQKTAQYVSLLGDQGDAVVDAANAVREGNAAAAQKADTKFAAGAEKNDNDPTLLLTRTLGNRNPLNASILDPNFQATKTYNDIVTAIRSDDKFKNASPEAIAEEAIKRSKAIDTPTAGSGSTAAFISAQNKYNDILATAMRGIATPLNDKIAPTLSAIADKYLNRRTPEADAKQVTEATLKGTQGKGTNESVPGESSANSVKRQIQGMRSTSATGDLLGEIGNKIGQIANMTVGTVTSLTIDGKGIKGEAEGSKDVWGSWFGGPSGLANIRENGPEAVVPFGKINEFVNDMRGKIPSAGPDLSGVSSQLSQLLPQAQAAIPNVSNVFSGNQGATLSDVVESLDKLNKSNGMMISYLETISNYSGKQVKATRGMSNNRFD
jgi:hypothetical protein